MGPPLAGIDIGELLGSPLHRALDLKLNSWRGAGVSFSRVPAAVGTDLQACGTVLEFSLENEWTACQGLGVTERKPLTVVCVYALNNIL